MGLCIVNIFKHSQQEATLHNNIYYFQLTHANGKKQKKLDKLLDVVYTILSSWWWAEEPPETCRAFVVINIIV